MMAPRQESYLEQAPAWVEGHTTWLPERIPPVRRLGYTLMDLAKRGLIDDEAVENFRAETLLADFAWRLLWADEDDRPEAESVIEMTRRADGIVVFIHGWDGSGEIWEELPAMVIKNNPNLMALVPDVNGFAGTPFQTDTPPIEKCNPPAVMHAVEQWFNLLGLRSPQDAETVRPVLFVGHSMGGASLFFMNKHMWRPGEAGRIAAAPALLHNDRMRQGFYRTLGAGILMSGRYEVIDRLTENVFAPKLIDVLAGGSSERVQAEHHRVFVATSEGVIARTFAAMGMLDVSFAHDDWPNFHVFLAHRDRLVGLQPMLELLEEFEFDPAQIRVVLGDHYFFSLGEKGELHEKNRDLLLADIGQMMAQMLE